MDAEQFTVELENLKKLMKGHSRVAIATNVNGFLDAAAQFIAFHKNEVTQVQRELDAERSINGALTKTNDTILLSLEKIDEKINKISECSSTTQNTTPTIPTYSQIASQSPSLQKFVILAKAKVPNLSPAQVKTTICNSLNPNDFNPLSITANRTNVAIELSSANGARRLLELIREHDILKDSVEAYEPSPRCPNVIVRNIDYSTTETDLIGVIISRNNLEIEKGHAKVLFTIKRRFYYDAVICLSPHAYHILKDMKTPILTGWTGSMFEETVLTGHCSKCFSLSHRSKECTMSREKKKCEHCLGEYSTTRTGNSDSPYFIHTRQCNSNNSRPKCTNCCSHSRFLNNADHYSLSPECPLYRARYQSVAKLICYDKSKVVVFRSRNETVNAESNSNGQDLIVDDSQTQN